MILCMHMRSGWVLAGPAMALLTFPPFALSVGGPGFDPIWFDIVVGIVTVISMATPSIRMNAFVMQSVLRAVTLNGNLAGVAPFRVADPLRVALIQGLSGQRLVGATDDELTGPCRGHRDLAHADWMPDQTRDIRGKRYGIRQHDAVPDEWCDFSHAKPLCHPKQCG
jgi:hypothetical protein